MLASVSFLLPRAFSFHLLVLILLNPGLATSGAGDLGRHDQPRPPVFAQVAVSGGLLLPWAQRLVASNDKHKSKAQLAQTCSPSDVAP